MYGHAAYVGAALESVARQTRCPDEIIVVNDASPDGARDVVDAARVRWPASLGDRTVVIDNPVNMGQSAAINQAVAAVSSDLVMVLNDDDYLFLDAVELVCDLFRTHPGMAMIGATCISFSDPGILSMAVRQRPSSVPLSLTYPSDVLEFRHANDLNMTHSGCTFRKLAWQAAGGYEPRRKARVTRSADRDFQLRVNALFPVAVSRRVPWSFWRNNSSVDMHRLT
jgi:glycosyltransferase involved in cell wall biosynthesis